MSVIPIWDANEPMERCRMVCESCNRGREVQVPAWIVRDGDLPYWRYLCCQCVGVAQMQAIIWRVD